jgi:hypothetical protein
MVDTAFDDNVSEQLDARTRHQAARAYRVPRIFVFAKLVDQPRQELRQRSDLAHVADRALTRLVQAGQHVETLVDDEKGGVYLHEQGDHGGHVVLGRKPISSLR